MMIAIAAKVREYSETLVTFREEVMKYQIGFNLKGRIDGCNALCKNEDLPPAVKHICPHHAQDIFREIFNSAGKATAREVGLRDSTDASSGAIRRPETCG